MLNTSSYTICALAREMKPEDPNPNQAPRAPFSSSAVEPRVSLRLPPRPQAVSGAGDGERDGDAAQSGDGLSDEQNHKILENNDMKVTYHPDVDVLRILFRDVPIEESHEDKPGVILDYDKDGNVVGLEVLNASQRVENPRGVDYAVTA
jgi:uncharacterized protein YuzE